MKPSYIKISLILFCFSIFLQSNSHAQGFNSVFSKDGSEVWAVGISGNLFRSADAGNTWSSYTLGSVTLNSVFAISQKVWIVGNNGSLQLSNNNGLSWTPYTLSGQNLNSVFFTDANTGWIVGNSGTILKTVNGGVNWTPQTSPVATNLYSVKFTSSSNGVACGEAGKVLYTTNGGTNWLQYTTPTTKNLLSIDQKTNTIIASASDGIVIKSTNNGSSWSIIDYKIVTKSDVNSVHMLDANTYYSCGGGGFIRKSTDGGATFTYQMNPMMANLVSIYFYDNLKGWAVSSKNNAVIWTVDGGNTWSLPPGTTVSYNWSQKLSSGGNIGNDICLHPTDKKAIFVASGSTIYRSGNIGENWTSIATISPTGSAHSFYVSPRDTNFMLAAIGSSGGRIVRTTNYGQTWTTTWGPGQLTSYGMPLEMDPNHPDTVYLGPNSSVIWRSTDFGATWSTYGTTTFTDPCDLIVLYNNSNIMYVGDQSGGGKFWKSTDYGVNWTLMFNAGGAEIPMIAVSSHDYNLIYFTNWGGSGYRKSTDQGVNWNLIVSTGGTWGTDLAKDDPTVPGFGIYGGTNNGYVSTNAGSTFAVSTIGGSVNYGMLFYDRGTLIAQQGGGMYKLTVNYTVPTVTSNNQISSEIPKEFALFQNYPNPFNPSTQIEYNVSKTSLVEIKIYNVVGSEVKSLVNSELSPGKYSVNLNSSEYGSGVYFYSLFINGQKIDSKKMMLIK